MFASFDMIQHALQYSVSPWSLPRPFAVRWMTCGNSFDLYPQWQSQKLISSNFSTIPWKLVFKPNFGLVLVYKQPQIHNLDDSSVNMNQGSGVWMTWIFLKLLFDLHPTFRKDNFNFWSQKVLQINPRRDKKGASVGVALATWWG